MFYQFHQNNSGGLFDVDDSVCHRLFIEADSADEANQIAEFIGCYWDGVEDGTDCDCCGDRWDKTCEEAYIKLPVKYTDKIVFNSIEEYAQYLVDNYGYHRHMPDCRIYYKSGDIKELNRSTP